MSQIRSKVSLKGFNTFGIDVNCKFFSSFKNSNDLNAIFNNELDEPLLILGGGSNLLFTKYFEV